MDGFFDKYGRMIIIAVAICFVLLFLTPMRNVIGSSINGFAGNFANKVGESLGTVKMPDAGIVKSGSRLKIEGNEYIVLEKRENNQALVMKTDRIGTQFFIDTGPNYNDNFRKKWNTYEDNTIDKYLENTWYKGLSAKMQNAIQITNIKQLCYRTRNIDSPPCDNYDEEVYNTISRHVFLPGVSEIGKVVDLKNPDKIQAFMNSIKFMSSEKNMWLRDSSVEGFQCDIILYQYNDNGKLRYDYAANYNGMCPTFVIDLSQVDYTVEGTTNYK